MTARAPDLEAEQELDLGSLWASIVARWWLPVTGAITKAGQTPLVAITVKGSPPRKIAQAANALATRVVSGVSSYVATKISSMRAEIAADESEIASIDKRLAVYDKAAQSG